jgi:hypothetical protein
LRLCYAVDVARKTGQREKIQLQRTLSSGILVDGDKSSIEVGKKVCEESGRPGGQATSGFFWIPEFAGPARLRALRRQGRDGEASRPAAGRAFRRRIPGPAAQIFDNLVGRMVLSRQNFEF